MKTTLITLGFLGALFLFSGGIYILFQVFTKRKIKKIAHIFVVIGAILAFGSAQAVNKFIKPEILSPPNYQISFETKDNKIECQSEWLYKEDSILIGDNLHSLMHILTRQPEKELPEGINFLPQSIQTQKDRDGILEEYRKSAEEVCKNNYSNEIEASNIVYKGSRLDTFSCSYLTEHNTFYSHLQIPFFISDKNVVLITLYSPKEDVEENINELKCLLSKMSTEAKATAEKAKDDSGNDDDG